MLKRQLQSLVFITLVTLFVSCQKSQSLKSSPISIGATAPTAVAVDSSINLQSMTTKAGTVIGHAIDCDNDGRHNDYRIDYDADGIPDDCIIGDDESLTANIDTTTPQNLFDSRLKLLDALTAECVENIKVEGDITYSICTTDGQPVKAAEFLTDLGDGLNIWFERRKVKAILRTHSGEMFFFDNGKLELMFEDRGMQVITSFSPEERQEYEELAQTAYQRIFQVFNID
ncbi:hypothetical protein Glo7428_3653 [Gloeocapsa sp. PCC 7428]|uniref:hypothetical protein n=1 Tax=Gloeocapsa sp. PCC 7428 TaxID=1173026 RepID=UPI0002A6197A|nr:hypothetical protein [Gloeocapsa sp. PCC 7428]AFZ32119.1 hypothetical protein Glo7428_3653 [Gloeocapsa sp. PCC 7428]